MSYSHYIKGRAINTGSEWHLKLVIESSAYEAFPADAKFVAHFRDPVTDKLLKSLTTENGGVIRADGKTLEFFLRADDTKDWSAKRVVMDAMRVDGSDPVHLGFDLDIPVKRSVTRL